MQIREIESGKVLSEQRQNTLYLIAKGSVRVNYRGGSYRLSVGDVIGLCEMGRSQTMLSYEIEDKVSLIMYSTTYEELRAQMEENPQAMKYFVSSFFKQLNEIGGRCAALQEDTREAWDYLHKLMLQYQEYCLKNKIPCEPVEGYEKLQEPGFESVYPKWLPGYYATQEQMLAVWDHNITDYQFLYGFLTKAVADIALQLNLCAQMQRYEDMAAECFLNDRGQDIFHRYVSVYGREVDGKGAISHEALEFKATLKKLQNFIEQRKMNGIFFSPATWNGFKQQVKDLALMDKNISGNDSLRQQQVRELTGSLDKILEFAECDPQIEMTFRKHLSTYKKMQDKNSTEESARLLRREITSMFYKIYIEAFQASIARGELPIVLKMFFEFGYMDEELAGIDNALYLYQLASNMQTNPECGVYSMYEWLTAIFEGKKEPGRNEFDLDYTEYLREQKKEGKITAQQEMMFINNPASKVLYELEQVFPLVNKVTYGRPSVFCPVFSEHNLLKPIDATVVSADKVMAVFDEVRTSDFGAFYRETLFMEPARGVPKEMISAEILPDVILTPNIGSRGIMWQEIEGKKRTTPARMLCSLFQIEDVRLIFIRMTAEFKWEMCKRIQGARWNDVTERSLTSEYCDYIQFYRKNRDLSADAKERVKAQMLKCKNSYKEMFVYDYMQWICYESVGVPKLNKVSREILFTYCPFTEKIRKAISINPLYKDLVEKYEIKQGQRVHHLDNLYQKIRNEGKEIPPEIIRFRRFVES